MLTILKELVAIPSVTGTEETKIALRKALEICSGFGFRTKNIKDMAGYGEIGEGSEIIGILCHLDVVPAGEGWEHPPFGCQVDEGRVYGRGVIDDKGPAVAAMYAMKDLLDEGKPLDKRIRLIFGTMEEEGEWHDMNYYKEYEEIPSYGFTPDANFPGIYGEKGIAIFKLSGPVAGSGFREVKGGMAPNMVPDQAEAILDNGETIHTSGKAAHGSLPHLGKNAISALMDQAAGKGAKLAEFYMNKIGYDWDGEKAGCGFHDEPSGGTTFNVGKITTADDRIELYVDIRYPVTVKLQDVIEALTASMKEFGLTAELISQDPPVYMDKNGPVITRLMEAYQELTGDRESEPELVGGGTYARAMDNIVAFGPLLPGREMTEHQRDEYILLEDLEKARNIYKLALEKLIRL